MSLSELRKNGLKISTQNLLRLEILIGFLVVNFFSFALSDFGFEGYGWSFGFYLSSVYLALLFISIGLNLSNRTLKKLILLVYTLSLIIVLKIAFERNFDEIHYLAFLFIYAFFCFSQSRVQTYSIISAILFLLIVGSSLMLDEVLISYPVLIISFIAIYLTGLAIAFSRSYLREKLIKRQKLLDDIFNISPDGLALLNLSTETMIECNKKFSELFEESKRKDLIGSKFNLVRLSDKYLFKSIDFERAVSIELADRRIVNIFFQRVENGKDELALATVKLYKNKNELNKSYDLDRLLSLSEESYKYLFEESSSLICILDEEGCIVDVNKTTTALSPYEKEELIGKKYNCLDFEENNDTDREAINQLAWEGKPQTIEKAIKGKNGERIELEVIIQKGKYFGKDVLICNSRDINERKVLERELVKNYDKFIALFELSPIGIISSDLEDHIIDFNSAFLTLFGYSKERASSLILTDLIHQDDIELFTGIKEKINEGPKVSEETKIRFFTADNREINAILNIVLQNNEKGEPSFFISQIINITDIIEGKKQVEESEESYRELFNNSSELVYLVDTKNNFVDINQTVLDQYGYTKEELMDAGPDILFAPGLNDLEAMSEKAARVMQHDETVNFLFWSKKKNGQIFPKDMKIKRGYYKGEIVMLITGRDVSESYNYRKELEEKEKRYRDLFERNLAGVYRTELNGKITECNDAFARIFGYPSTEVIKESMIATDFYADPKDRLELLDHLEANDHIEGWQVKLKRKNGEYIDVLLNVSKISSEEAEYYEGNLIDISELTKTQEQLRLSQVKYQQLIDNSAFGILILNLKKEIVFANLKASQLLSYDRAEELHNLSIFSLGKGENDDYLEELYQEESEYINQTKEIHLYGKGNKEITVEITPTLIVFDNNPAIQLSFIDISDRKKVEKAQEKAKVAETFNKILQAELKEKEKAQRKLIDAQSYMEGIIESSLDMIFTTDLDGKINKLNSAAQKELRVKDSEILNKPLNALFKENKDAIYVFKQLENRSSFSGEIELIRSDGTTFPSYFSLSYLYNAEGIRLGIMGVSKDISEIKAKESEINQQAAKLNAIIESSSHFFFTVNKDYRLTTYNHVFENDLKEKMGVELSVNKSFFDIIPKDHPEKKKIDEFWKVKFEKAFKGKSSNFEIKRQSLSGEFYYRDFYLNPVYIVSDEVEEVSGIGHDITEKKHSEQELKSSLKEKEVLLKEVHHRVKNNMQVISSILSLQSSSLSDKKVLNILKESQNRIKAMAFIHERLYRTKDFSQLKFSDYVKSLTESLVSTYDTTRNDIKLYFDIDEVFLNLDSAIPCGLILNELISNSLKYAFVGRKEGTLSVRLKVNEQNEVQLSVYDDGVGIDKDIELDNTETLGLQLVHTLTEQLEGKISLSRENGSKFDLVFTKKE